MSFSSSQDTSISSSGVHTNSPGVCRSINNVQDNQQQEQSPLVMRAPIQLTQRDVSVASNRLNSISNNNISSSFDDDTCQQESGHQYNQQQQHQQLKKTQPNPHQYDQYIPTHKTQQSQQQQQQRLSLTCHSPVDHNQQQQHEESPPATRREYLDISHTPNAKQILGNSSTTSSLSSSSHVRSVAQVMDRLQRVDLVSPTPSDAESDLPQYTEQ